MSSGRIRWQQVITNTLDRQPSFALNTFLKTYLGRQPTKNERVAAHVALGQLKRLSKCIVVQLRSDAGKIETTVARPDCRLPDGRYLRELNIRHDLVQEQSQKKATRFRIGEKQSQCNGGDCRDPKGNAPVREFHQFPPGTRQGQNWLPLSGKLTNAILLELPTTSIRSAARCKRIISQQSTRRPLRPMRDPYLIR